MWKLPGWGRQGLLAAVGLALVLSHLWIRLQVVSAGMCWPIRGSSSTPCKRNTTLSA